MRRGVIKRLERLLAPTATEAVIEDQTCFEASVAVGETVSAAVGVDWPGPYGEWSPGAWELVQDELDRIMRTGEGPPECVAAVRTWLIALRDFLRRRGDPRQLPSWIEEG